MVMTFPACKVGSSPGVLLGPQDQRPQVSNECMTSYRLLWLWVQFVSLFFAASLTTQLWLLWKSFCRLTELPASLPPQCWD